jgi:SAM-dependent methyltransferase
MSVLHFAPEPVLARRLSAFENVSYLSADLDPDVAMVAADITDLPFDDSTFDLILCSHVLEHVPQDGAAMREMLRVLRPGATALLMHPVDYGRGETYEDWSLTSREERQRAFLQDDHVRLYGRDLADRLTAAGFEVEMSRYLDQFSEDAARRYGLVSPSRIPTLRGDDIYICRRPG